MNRMQSGHELYSLNSSKPYQQNVFNLSAKECIQVWHNATSFRIQCSNQLFNYFIAKLSSAACIRYQVSGIKYQLQSFMYHSSCINIEYQISVSNFKYYIWSMKYQVSVIKYQVSCMYNIGYHVSDIKCLILIIRYHV